MQKKKEEKNRNSGNFTQKHRNPSKKITKTTKPTKMKVMIWNKKNKAGRKETVKNTDK